MPGIFAVSFVAFVENDQRIQNPQGVAEGGFDLPAPEATLLFKRVEVGNFFQERAMAFGVVITRKEAVEPAAISEHPELFFRLPIR